MSLTPRNLNTSNSAAAVLNITKNEEAAKAFLAYLQTDEAAAVFESVGFTPLY